MRRAFALPPLRSALVQTAALLALAFSAHSAVGQNTPIISGGLGFLHGTTKGQNSFFPTVMPVVALPITRYFLFETRGSFLEVINERTNGKSYQTRLARNVSFLQMDYFANRHMTFVAGKFLTPFNTYGERLSPIWIGNFQDGPLSLPIGNIGSTGTGGELRGSLYTNNTVNIGYASFFSANVTANQFKSSRATGGRAEAYFPASGLELGASYDHMFEGSHPNATGAHLWWQLPGSPLAIKSEYSHGTHSQGYWIEAAYRLSRISGPESFIGRAVPVFRMQQTFRNSPDSTDGLPAADTQRADFGLDYFLPHEVRINTSYSRQFSSTGNGNIWKTAIVYRFLFPAWPGKR